MRLIDADACVAIEDAPTVDAVPDAKPLWDYCPNCGAHLEGAEE